MNFAGDGKAGVADLLPGDAVQAAWKISWWIKIDWQDFVSNDDLSGFNR